MWLLHLDLEIMPARGTILSIRGKPGTRDARQIEGHINTVVGCRHRQTASSRLTCKTLPTQCTGGG